MKQNINNLDDHIEKLLLDPIIRSNTILKEFSKPPIHQTSPFPSSLNPRLKTAINRIGINTLYNHQIESYNNINNGMNLAISSGTSSGKSLCYNLPILNKITLYSDVTALYLFPTKALTQDQYIKLTTILNYAYADNETNNINPSIYDGDTDIKIRKHIRDNSRLILSNPDMLHNNILPHHHQWQKYLMNLKYIVIDEVHTYRGVFGSHFANVIRRLKRVLKHYGSNPQFILTSATINNPKEHSENLIEEQVHLITNDNFPFNNRKYILYNTPFINTELGIRKNPLHDIVNFSSYFIHNNIQIIIFTKTRKMVEVLVNMMKDKNPQFKNQIEGYRSGYLSNERRRIEESLRKKRTLCVIATNALELGIDIGNIQVVILNGYPGTISSTHQQFGRAGRNKSDSLGIFIASNSPLDQYIYKFPDYIFNSNPENALINSDNLAILYQHLKCSIYELPFNENDIYGKSSNALISPIINLLDTNKDIIKSNHKYYSTVNRMPHIGFSIRNISSNNIRLYTNNNYTYKAIGDIDENSAYWMVHPGAVYIHNGEKYIVENFDLDNKEIKLNSFNDHYYTQPIFDHHIEYAETLNKNENELFSTSLGNITITNQVAGYLKISNYDHQIIGRFNLEMPIKRLNTSGYWISLKKLLIDNLQKEFHRSSFNRDYGKEWSKIRKEVLNRDNYKCQSCGEIQSSESFHVHHKIPLSLYNNHFKANKLENLVTLCPRCHRKAELNVYIHNGLSGIAYSLHHLIPIYLMCDINDLGRIVKQTSHIFQGKPTLLIHENIPDGVGLCDQLYKSQNQIFLDLYKLISECECINGCPSCIGPSSDIDNVGKHETLKLLDQLLGNNY